MTNPWILSLWVGLGGFAGSVSRYGLNLTAQRYSLDWPIGTLLANVIGCLLIGMLAVLAARGDLISPAVRLALATGFCGGFTAMSSLIYETAAMIRTSEYLHATAYVAGTFLLSMAAFLAGTLAMRLLLKFGDSL